MVLNLFNELSMVGVAQLVRAPDCGSGGRGFKSHHSPKKSKPSWLAFFLFNFFCDLNHLINHYQ